MDANFVAAALAPDLCDKSAPWHNLVIEGDNYDALRWLRMTMAGRIKCIYVDPPYNTGNKDWVYNDRYFSADDRYRHSTWLEFLYRRFTLARDLLTEDGVILVSINDENRAKLELMLDEALPGMRVGSLVWRTKDSANDAEHNFSAVHEHVLIYGNAGADLIGYELDRRKYKNPDGDPRGDYSTDPITQPKDRIERPNGYFPIQDAKTGWWYPCNPDSVWRYLQGPAGDDDIKSKEPSIYDLQADGRLVFTAKKCLTFQTKEELVAALRTDSGPQDGNGHPLLREDLPDLFEWVGRPIGLGRPYRKAFWDEKDFTKKPVSSWVITKQKDAIEELTNLFSDKQGVASREIIRLFGRKAFNFPKPSSLVKSLVEVCAGPRDLVLDFFAGSATTAQAVMELNAEDGGDRRFIMVSSTERTVEEPEKNLCRDVTAERVRRLNASEGEAYADLAAEFAYLRCREIDFTDLDYHDGLMPGEAWNALEALHGLPLTPHEPKRKWQAHEGEDVILVQVDKFAADLVPYLQKLAERRANVFVYAWAPGQVREAVGPADFEIHPVRDTLVRRFQQ